MNTNEDNREVSTDQPAEQSTPDQVTEESQDQPIVAQDKTPEESTPDQPQEEEKIIIGGEEYSTEEAKELLSKGKHFTYNMQQVRAKERELEAKLAEGKALTPEEQEIQEARATLKRYGVVTEDEVDAKLQEFQAKQARLSEFQMFRQGHPEVNDFAMRMIEGAANAWNLTYEQAYQQGWGTKQPQKVVKKKIVGASKRATTPVSNKDGAELTRADIAAMSTEEYNKRAAEIDQLVREGRLK